MTALATQSALRTPHSALSSGPPPDYLPIMEFARLANLSGSAVRRMAAALKAKGLAGEYPPPGGVGRPCWWIHKSANGNVARSLDRNGGADLSAFPLHFQQRAVRLGNCVRRWWEIERENPRLNRLEAADWLVAESKAQDPQFQVSRRSLQQWEKVYSCQGVAGLIPGYGFSRADQVGEREATPTRHADDISFFYRLYHVEDGPDAAKCHRRTLVESQRKGSNWPESVEATYKWLERYDDKALTCLMREGYDAWRHRYMDYQEADYSAMLPGDQYVADHHQMKCFVRYRGKVIRPWLTAIQDCATRMFVGWHFGPTPHSDAIRVCIKNAITGYGVCKRFKIDNGKDFTSKAMVGFTKKQAMALRKVHGRGWRDIVRHDRTKAGLDPSGWMGILPEFGMTVVLATRYEPQGKVIERAFREVAEGFTRDQATWCGTSPERKPDSLKLILAQHPERDVPLLDTLAAEFGRWVDDEYHRRPHQGDGMNGMSPLERWQSAAVKPPVALEGAVQLLCAMRGEETVRANGVHVKIGAATISYGFGHSALSRYKGRKVLVAVDPQNVGQADIFTLDKKHMCTVASNKKLDPCSEADEVREAIAAVNRAKKDSKRARDTAHIRRKDATQLVREQRAQRHQLLATGTDHARPLATAEPCEAGPIRVVQTGFEAASEAVSKLAQYRSEGAVEEAAAPLDMRSFLDDAPADSDFRLPTSDFCYESYLAGDEAASEPDDDGTSSLLEGWK